MSETALVRADRSRGWLTLAGHTFGIEDMKIERGILLIDCLLIVERGSVTVPKSADGWLYGRDGAAVLEYPYRFESAMTAKAGDTEPAYFRIIVTVRLELNGVIA